MNSKICARIVFCDKLRLGRARDSRAGFCCEPRVLIKCYSVKPNVM